MGRARQGDTSPQGAAWLWQQILAEARELAGGEPILATLHHAVILNHADLAAALSHFLAERLGSRDASAALIRPVCHQAHAGEPDPVAAAAADDTAPCDRPPAR